MCYSDLSKKACLELLLYIATLDGDTDDRELGFFREIAAACEMTDDAIDEMRLDVLGGLVSVDEIIEQIGNDSDRYKVLEDLVTLCYADGTYSDNEKEGIRFICSQMSISEEDLKKVEKECFIEEGKNRIRAGIGFLGDGFAKLGSKGLEGGRIAGKHIGKGLGIISDKVTDAVASAKKLRQENQELRDLLEKITVSEAVKQKVITQLNSKISGMKEELIREKEKNRRNEELIRLLQAQLDDLAMTLEVAEQTRIA